MIIAYFNRRKPKYGVGINDADYITSPMINGKRKTCPFYIAWSGMMKRCYSEHLHKKQPTYKDCSVIGEWHSFMAFRAWMETQDWQGKHLDKDIMYPGNKVYSPKTCVFISHKINCLLVNNAAKRGKYPQGVVFHLRSHKFRASVNIHDKYKTIGDFSTPEQASDAYRTAKRLHILRIACCEPDIRVKQGLYRHSIIYL